MLRKLFFIVIAGMMLGLSGNSVIAAPQILAAVPPGHPLTLTCDGATCEVELSSICLQQRRNFPLAGTPYQIAEEDISDIQFVGMQASGETIDLPARLLTVKSHRSHTAVRFAVDQSKLQQYAVNNVSVMFDRLVALYPQVENDLQAPPQTRQDKDVALAGIKRVEGIWNGINSEEMTTTRLINRLGNYLPESGTVSREITETLFSTVAEQEKSNLKHVIDEAKRLVMNCQQRTGRVLRHCLGDIHDQVMRDSNLDYWNLLKPGS